MNRKTRLKYKLHNQTHQCAYEKGKYGEMFQLKLCAMKKNGTLWPLYGVDKVETCSMLTFSLQNYGTVTTRITAT